MGSGMSSLVLKKQEVALLNQFMKKTSQNLQKLPDSTPACVVAFLGGVLPGTAAIHLRQLGTFGMITRASGSILLVHATQVLTSSTAPGNS